jgi:predicted enzyme related to lactoylglutathione lyase
VTLASFIRLRLVLAASGRADTARDLPEAPWLVPRQGTFAALSLACCRCQTRVMVTAAESAVTTRAAGFAPCFPVRDIRAALAHYGQLGFEVMPYTAGMAWAWARLGAAELHLFVKDDHDPATTAAAADLAVADADEFERVLQATGVSGTSDPYDTPYGREVVHVDPDNNLMRFVAPVPPPARRAKDC